MTDYKPGDIVLIPFPFTDFSTLKQRPAIVLSSDDFNRTHQDIIVAAITSHIPGKMLEEEYLLNKIEQVQAGLPKPSMIKLGKIVTLDQRFIRKKLGQLPRESLKIVVKKLESVLKNYD